MKHTCARVAVTMLSAGVALVGIAGPTAAHPHQASVAHQGDGQVLANGANHGPYVGGLTCGGDRAAYGLETAHHGPDAGTPGKADGCFQLDGTSPALDVTNPSSSDRVGVSDQTARRPDGSAGASGRRAPTPRERRECAGAAATRRR